MKGYIRSFILFINIRMGTNSRSTKLCATQVETIPKVTLKVVPRIFEEIPIHVKNFEKRTYNPKNVTYKSTNDVYFLTKLIGKGYHEFGERRKTAS